MGSGNGLVSSGNKPLPESMLTQISLPITWIKVGHDIIRTSSKTAESWRLHNLINGKSTWVQVMAWCHQATSHYLSQCWPRSLSPLPESKLAVCSTTPCGVARTYFCLLLCRLLPWLCVVACVAGWTGWRGNISCGAATPRFHAWDVVVCRTYTMSQTHILTLFFIITNLFVFDVLYDWLIAPLIKWLTDHWFSDSMSYLFYSQYPGCWWPGSIRSQGISSNGVDLVSLECSNCIVYI